MVANKLSLAVASVLALAMVACGDDDTSPQVASAEADGSATATIAPIQTSAPFQAPIVPAAGTPVTHSVTLPQEITVSDSETIRSGDEMPRLEGWGSDDEVGRTPIAAFGDRFVVQKMYLKRPAEHPVEYEMWDSRTGQFSSLWSVPAGTINEFGVSEGSWLAIVETGYSLPLPKWSLIVRDVDSGEVRTIAESDSRIPGLAAGIQLGPAGFAPLPAIGAGRVAWTEFFVSDTQIVGKRIQLYDIASQKTTTIAEIEDASKGDLQSPSLGGTDAAWLSWDERGEPRIVIRSLTSGSTEVFAIGGDPYSCALSGDGRLVAWDDTQYAQQGTRAKYALNRDAGEVRRYSESRGWGTYTSGHHVSWIPWEDEAGFYDMSRNIKYELDLQGAKSVFATVMGGWYVWQETRDTGVGSEGSESTYRFSKLT
jgi:hypothetical protein